MEFEENDMLLSLDPSGIDICGNEKVTIASDGLVKIFNDAKSTNITSNSIEISGDNKIRLSDTGIDICNNFTISYQELSLLDGVTSNIQQQISANVLTTASDSLLGGIKVGNNLSINGEGVLSSSTTANDVLGVGAVMTTGEQTIGGNKHFSNLVGIGGTNSTTSQLYIKNDNTAIHVTQSDDTARDAIQLHKNDTDYYAGIGFKSGLNITTPNLPITFETASTERMKINNDGKIGINQSNPAHTLDIDGDINFTGTIKRGGVEFFGGFWSTTGNKLYYDTGNVGVGVGVTDPANRLTVQGPTTNVDTETAAIKYGDDTGSQYLFAGLNFGGILSSSGNGLYINQSNGNVGIGTTNFDEKLVVGGNGIFTGSLKINGNKEVPTKEYVDGQFTSTNANVTTNTNDIATINTKGLWEKNGNKVYYNTDNIGIGTNNPASKLEVVGDISASGVVKSNGGKTVATEDYVDGKIDAVIGDPNLDIALDTLKEIADAINGDAGFGTMVQNKFNAIDTSFVNTETATSNNTANINTNTSDISTLNTNVSTIQNKVGILNKTTKAFTVTVASKTSAHPYHNQGSGSGYLINGIESPELLFKVGTTYTFDTTATLPDHPFHFYLDANKSTQYTTDVTGAGGQNVSIQITETTPSKLYYQCASHSYMGNYATVELERSDVTSQDVGQLSGATSNIQNQLDAIVSSQWTTNSSNNIHFADKVGIGISDPTSKLEVIGDISAAGNIIGRDIKGTHVYIGNRNVISGSAQGSFTDLELKNGSTHKILAQGDTGDMQMAGILQVDTINENTSGSGVTIEGVLVKDGNIGSDTTSGNIQRHTVIAQNYYVGTRNVIDAGAGGSFNSFEIKNSTTGNVGILGDGQSGDITMTGKLDVSGVINARGNIGVSFENPTTKISLGNNNYDPNDVKSKMIAFHDNNLDGHYYSIGMAGETTNDAGVAIWSKAAPTKNNPALFVKNNDNVGIGNVIPGEALDVCGNIRASGTISDGTGLLATTTYVDGKVAELVDSAPEQLNTLNELAAALNDTDDFGTVVNNKLSDIDSSINNIKSTIANTVANNTVTLYRQNDMRLTHDKANVKEFKWFREDDSRSSGNSQIARSITDDNPVLGGDNSWANGRGYYSSSEFNGIFTTGNPGSYTGNGSTTVDGVTKPGIWFEWEFFEKVKANRFRISTNGARLYGGYDGAPTYITIAGSNDGSTWNSVNSEETLTKSDYDDGTTTIANTTNIKISKFAERDLDPAKIASYKFYRLIIRGRINDPTGQNDGSYRLFIGEFELIGSVVLDSNDASLNHISDVDTTTTPPTNGQALIWDNANLKWKPGDVANTTTLNDLTDVNTSGAANGHALIYDSGNWVPGTGGAFTTSGNNAYYNSGNVGIGTDDPKAKLEVSGDLNIKATSDTWNTSVGKGLYMRFYDGINKGYIQSIDRSSSDTHYPLIYHASRHEFRNKTTVHMNIETNGYVGIGTTNPGAKLHVKDTGSAGAILIENESLALLQLKQPTLEKVYNIELGRTDGELSFRSTTGEKMRIKENGYVGIGTTNPSQKLEVIGKIHAESARIGAAAQNTNYASFSHKNNTGNNDYALIQTNDGSTKVNAKTGQTINLCIENNSKMTVDSSGKVGIGTTAPTKNLEVAGDIKFTGDLYDAAGLFSGSRWTESNGNIFRSSGNVGIGTSSTDPDANLQLNRTGGAVFNLQDGNKFWHFNGPRTGGGGATDRLAIFYNNNGTYTGELFTISSTGSLGVGTNNPSEKLDVTGNIKASGSIEGNTVKVTALNTTSNHNKVLMINSSGEIDICNNVSSSGSGGGGGGKWIGGTNNKIYYNSGNVGIGTSDPGEKLQVNGKILAGSIKLTSLVADTNTGDPILPTWEGSGNDVILLPSGNVGIGSTSPAAKLDVNGGIQISGHILPSSNANYDIGSAEYKIRHLFLSDNSLWLGDKHKIDVKGDKIKFKKRKVSAVPSAISAHGGHFSGAKTFLGLGAGATESNVTLQQWLKYARSLDDGGSPWKAEIDDLYNNNAEDFDEDNDANYVLPAATDSALGGVKQGSGVTIAADGTISAASQIWAEDTGNISRASGNVGIGTTNPLTYLHIKGTHPANTELSDANDFYMLLGSDEWSNYSYRLIGFGYIDDSTKCPPAYIGYKTASASGNTYGDLIFGTRNGTGGGAPSERMRIMYNGNVGIGNTAPSEKLDVTGNIKTSGTLILGSEPTSSNHAATKNYVDSKPTTFLGLTDTPSSFTASKLLAVNSGGNAVEFIDTPSTVSANPSTGGAELATISIDGVNYNLPHKTNALTGGDILLFHADVAGASVGGTLSNMNIYTTFKYWTGTGATPTQSSTAKNSIFKGYNFITETPQSNTNGTYVSSLTVPKDTPTELEIIIHGWKCGGGSSGVSRLTVTRNGVDIYKREKEAPAADCGLYSVSFIYYDFKEGDVLTFQTDENNSVGTRDFEQTDYTTPWAKASGSITIKALNSVGKSLIQKESYGQTLETIAGVCDGRTIKAESGIYTLQNVTSSQEIGSGTRDIVTGSSINYKPPHGTKQVTYKFTVAFRGDVDSGGGNEFYPMPFFTLFIDNDSGNEEEIQVIRNFTGPWTHSHVITLTAIINISDTTDIANGKVKWNENRTLKLKCYEFDNSRQVTLHEFRYWEGNTGFYLQKPQLEIVAIGTKVNHSENIATYVVAKQGEMRVSHDKANVKEFTHYESDAINAIVDAENITDDKTNNTGDQGWYTNNMFYTKDGIYNSTSGLYTGNASTTFSQNPQSTNYSGGTYTGTWFQWQFFEKVKVSQLRIAGNPLSHRDRSPGKVRLLGSNDGSIWYSLGNESNFGWADYERVANVGGSNVTSGKFAEQTIEGPGSYKYYRLVVNSIIKDSANGRTNLAISEVELIGKIEIESSPVNNTTLVVANSKGIRVTHDKANIKAFTFPVDELTSWSDQRRPEGLTDDKGIYSYDGYNMYHSTYANSSSIFDANGDYIGWNGTVQSTSGYNAHWMQWEFISKVKISSIRVMGSSYSGNNDHKQSVPTNAKLFGSNDASTWVQIGNDLNETQQSAFFDGDTPKWKEFTINANKEYKYIRYAVSKVYGKYGTSNLSYLAIAELEMFGDVIVEQAGVTNVVKGQVLEKFAGIADGRTLEGRETTYTLDNVTAAVLLNENGTGNPEYTGNPNGTNSSYSIGAGAVTLGYSYVTGSQITNYKLLHGTKQIIYTFTCHCANNASSLGDWSAAAFNLLVDDQVIHNQHRAETNSQYKDATVTIHFVLDITDGQQDISHGKLNWIVGETKTIKLEATDRYNTKLHSPNIYIEDSPDHVVTDIIKPQVEITAIGEKTTVNSFVPHDGMTIQTQHKDYKKKVMKDNANWDAIDDDLDTGFVVKIQPTSANSKVMINTTVHIGMIMGNSHDARWWGARLWRKIGSGSWLEVTEANGDETRETLGTTTLANNGGTKCWFSNTSGIENSSTEDILIANVTASFLDSPNTNDTIYYTIRWGSRLGNLSVNSTLYLNRAHSQHDAYRPAPMSSITASEIWSGGTPYVPPIDPVITKDNTAKLKFENTKNLEGTTEKKIGSIEFAGDVRHKYTSQYNMALGSEIACVTDFPSGGSDADESRYALAFKTRQRDKRTTAYDDVTEAMRINGSGYVGIGNTNPTALLEVGQNASGTDNTSSMIIAGGYAADPKPIHFGGWNATPNKTYARIQTSTNLHFDAPNGGHIYHNWYTPNAKTLIGGSSVEITNNLQCKSINLTGSTSRTFYRSGAWIKYAHLDGIGALPNPYRNTATRNWGIYCPAGDMFIEGYIYFSNHSHGSDIRIKKNIIETNDDDCLDILKTIKVYNFDYKDPLQSLSKNENKTFGYIADNLTEKLPGVVKEIPNFIPDHLQEIENPQFEKIDLENGSKWVLKIENIEFKEEEDTGRYKFKVTNDDDDKIHDVILTIEDDNKSFIFEKKWDNVFLYGKEVVNFKTVDGDQMTSLCHGAIKELSRKNDALQTENNELRSRLEALESAVLALQNNN